MSSRRLSTACLFLLLSVTGCGHRVDLWITPRATLTFAPENLTYTLDETGSTVPFPQPPHDLRITAPGRATVAAHINFVHGTCLGALVNAYCPESQSANAKEHPAHWLRQDGAPFQLPAPGQGVIISANDPDVTVSIRDIGADKVSFRGELVNASNPQRSLPVVVPLEAGREYHVIVGRKGYEAWSQNVGVESGVYRWFHANLSRPANTGPFSVLK